MIAIRAGSHALLIYLCAPLAILLLACEPKLHVGEWTCSANGDAMAIPSQTDPVAMPWSTGFEDRFCDYTQFGGFCYGVPMASYTTVRSPVHSGRYAAAFSVTSTNVNAQQARCVRQGVLPNAAYYGAWYFVPARTTNAALWNLLHFQSGDTSAPHGLWDVSLVNGANGALQLVVYDFLNARTRRPANPMPIPIGAWFHVEFYLKRAADASGEIALYQDGEVLIDAANVITDDSSWGQWYVGNLATGLTPPDSTLYVDDVTISDTR